MPKIQDVIIEEAVSGVGGGVQRVAWELSQPIGFILTAGLVLGGLAGASFARGRMADVLSALGNSGAAIGGWVVTEQFLLGGSTPAFFPGARNKQPAGLKGQGAQGLGSGRLTLNPRASGREVTRLGQMAFSDN